MSLVFLFSGQMAQLASRTLTLSRDGDGTSEGCINGQDVSGCALGASSSGACTVHHDNTTTRLT